MYLNQTIYFALAVCFLMIGLHQTWQHGFANSYWAFMVMAAFLALFRLDVSKRGMPKVETFRKSQPKPKVTASGKPKRKS